MTVSCVAELHKVPARHGSKPACPWNGAASRAPACRFKLAAPLQPLGVIRDWWLSSPAPHPACRGASGSTGAAVVV